MLNMAFPALLPLPTLAIGRIEMVIFAIAILFTVGGWVMNGIKKIKENNEAKERAQNATYRSERKSMRIGSNDDDDDELEEISPAGSMTTKERLDALAARRRAQMANVRAQSSRTGPAATSEPDNLTAAQRAARDRAKKAYERRAELLAKQQNAQQDARRLNAERAKAQQQAKARADAVTKARRTQSSSSSSSSQSQSQSARQQQQAALQRAQSQSASPRGGSRAAQRASQNLAAMNAPAAQAVPTSDQSRRIRRSTPLKVETPDGKATINDNSLEVVRDSSRRELSADKLKRALTGKSIRAAFVLKEVLDRPIAMREPEDQPGTLNFK